MKRYAVDANTLVESKDGAVMLIADLPVEALETFDRPFVMLDRRNHEPVTWVTLTESQYNQLRDLLLAIRGEKS